MFMRSFISIFLLILFISSCGSNTQRDCTDCPESSEISVDTKDSTITTVPVDENEATVNEVEPF